jgi:hypothetical protein
MSELSNNLSSFKSLEKVIPNFAEFLSDPKSVLGNYDIRIRSPRPFLSLIVLGAVLVALVFATIVIPEGIVVIAVAFVIVLSALVYLGWPVRQEVLIGLEGVELIYQKTVVFCPWTLFNTRGQPYNPDPVSVVGTYLEKEITMPVAASAVKEVELRQRNVLQGRGPNIWAKQLRFLSHNEIVLAADYEVSCMELARLFLLLGHSLGSRQRADSGTLAAQEVPGAETSKKLETGVDVRPSEIGDQLISVGTAGWITLRHVTRLYLPPLCCSCCAPATEHRQFRVPEVAIGVGHTPDSFREEEPFDIDLPFCHKCGRKQRIRTRLGAIIGLGVGTAVLGCFIAYYMVFRPGQQIEWWSIALPIVGAVIGYRFAGNLWSVVNASYVQNSQRLRLKFKNAEFAARFVEHMRQILNGQQPNKDQ